MVRTSLFHGDDNSVHVRSFCFDTCSVVSSACRKGCQLTEFGFACDCINKATTPTEVLHCRPHIESSSMVQGSSLPVFNIWILRTSHSCFDDCFRRQYQQPVRSMIGRTYSNSIHLQSRQCHSRDVRHRPSKIRQYPACGIVPGDERFPDRQPVPVIPRHIQPGEFCFKSADRVEDLPVALAVLGERSLPIHVPGDIWRSQKSQD